MRILPIAAVAAAGLVLASLPAVAQQRQRGVDRESATVEQLNEQSLARARGMSGGATAGSGMTGSGMTGSGMSGTGMGSSMGMAPGAGGSPPGNRFDQNSGSNAGMGSGQASGPATTGAAPQTGTNALTR